MFRTDDLHNYKKTTTTFHYRYTKTQTQIMHYQHYN